MGAICSPPLQVLMKVNIITMSQYDYRLTTKLRSITILIQWRSLRERFGCYVTVLLKGVCMHCFVAKLLIVPLLTACDSRAYLNTITECHDFSPIRRESNINHPVVRASRAIGHLNTLRNIPYL